MKLKFKLLLNKITPFIVYFFFCALFASIPLCSFQTNLTIVTWILTILFCLCVIISILFIDKKIVFGLIEISFILFILSAFLSALFNKFLGFVVTPYLLSILTIFTIIYINGEKKRFDFLLNGAFVGTLVFLFAFVVTYKNDIFSLNFYRLGSIFGDENDISVFMSFGLLVSLYYFFTVKKWWIKLLMILSFVLFVGLGLLTGSKVFIFSLFALFVTTVVFLIKNKNYVLVSIAASAFIVAIIIFMVLPIFSTLRERLFLFFATFFGGASQNDLSTIYRIEMFEGGIKLFFKKPLFGYGPSGFQYFGGFNDGWSHNHLSESLCNYGIIGSVLTFFPFCYCTFLAHKNNYLIKKTIVIYGLVFCFVSMISIPFFIEKFFSIFCGLIFGFCSFDTKRKKTILIGVKK